MINQHKKQPLEKCPKCPEPLTADHEIWHHDEKLEFSCSECPYKASRERKIRSHAAKYHKDLGYEDKIQCPKCPVMIQNRKGRIQRHEEEQHSDSLPFGCDQCGFRSLTKVGIQQHKSRYHDRANAIPCGLGCGRTFIQKCTMTYHMKRFCKFVPNKVELRQKELESGWNDNKKMKMKKRNKERRERFEAMRSENGMDT